MRFAAFSPPGNSLPGHLAPWHLHCRALSLPGPLVPLVHDVDARIPNDRRTLLMFFSSVLAECIVFMSLFLLHVLGYFEFFV